MGLVGLLIALGLMVLGAGYWVFTDSQSMTVVNSQPSLVADGLSRYEEVKQQALDVKQLVEQRASDSGQPAHTPLLAESVAGKQPTDNDQQGAEALHIVNHLMKSGFAVLQKTRAIDTIVLHSSYDLLDRDPYSVEGVVKEYEDYGVSAHYLINRSGKIYRLVEDKNIAYHAGVSKMPDGRTNVNDFSIGIEMMNTETGQFTAAQYTAVNDLIAYLKTKYVIKSVVGHADIAPGRKTDPWNFDWKKLK